jgi:sugar phosphate isomerase/epimerase
LGRQVFRKVREAAALPRVPSLKGGSMPPIRLCLFASTPDFLALGFLVKVLTGTPDELGRTAVAWGYDGIEFMPDPERVPDPIAFEKALAPTGAVMPVVNSGRIAAQKLALIHEDAEIRRRALQGFKAMLDFGGHFRSRVHLGICRGRGIPGASKAEMDRMAEDVFRELAAHAERAGATILLEAAETEFTSYINTMDEVMAWVDRIGSPAFAPMLDTHQLYGAERSIEAGIRAARGRAQHIHLFEPSRYPPGVLVGKPILDWPRIGQLLREEGLPGSASVVIASEGDPEPVARASVAYLRRLFAS